MSRGFPAVAEVTEAAVVMASSTTFPSRLFWAWSLLQSRLGRSVSQTWLATEMGKELGQGPLSQSTLSGYFTGKFQPTDLDRYIALAKVLGVDPGWLAFGEASAAPAPPNPFPTAESSAD